MVACTACVLCFSCGGDKHRRASSSPRTDDSLVVKFLYRPSEKKLMVVLHDSSILIQRFNHNDSLVSECRDMLDTTHTGIRDSLFHALNHVSEGEYRKENVFNGTRITVGYGKKEIVCEGCLNDYVLEAAGRVIPRQPDDIGKLQKAVTAIQYLIGIFEKKKTVTWKKIAVSTKTPSDSVSDYSITIHEDTVRREGNASNSRDSFQGIIDSRAR